MKFPSIKWVITFLNHINHLMVILTSKLIYLIMQQKLMTVDKLFAKALRIFVTCLLVNNNSFGKLILSLELPIIFDDNLKTTSVLFFIADFHFLSCEFDSLTFKLLYWVILYWQKLNYSVTYLHNIYFYSSLWKVQKRLFCFFKNEEYSCISCTI